MRKKTIWVVDDDVIYQIIIKKIIEKSEIFSVPSIFRNGKEALIALENAIENNETLPDIILLDIDMPIMDGWGFMDEMLLMKPKINKEIAVYIASSSIAIEDREKAKTYSEILGYLTKPVAISDLQMIASSI